jgi:hypothetical protein
MESLAAGMRPPRDRAIGRKDAATFRAPECALLAGSHVMQTKWIFSSTFLPYTGEPIEFMLEDRNQPIHGTFANGAFHSRWADYDVDRVASWRGSDGDLSAVPMQIPTVSKGTFITTLRRLTKVLSRGRVAPIVPPRSHARTNAVPAISMQPVASSTRHIASNQISS